MVCVGDRLTSQSLDCCRNTQPSQPSTWLTSTKLNKTKNNTKNLNNHARKLLKYAKINQMKLHALSSSSKSPSNSLETATVGIFKGRMSSIIPNQQCQGGKVDGKRHLILPLKPNVPTLQPSRNGSRVAVVRSTESRSVIGCRC